MPDKSANEQLPNLEDLTQAAVTESDSITDESTALLADQESPMVELTDSTEVQSRGSRTTQNARKRRRRRPSHPKNDKTQQCKNDPNCNR